MKELKQFFKYTWIYFVFVGIIMLAGMGLIETLYPSTPNPVNWSWKGVLMFMGVSAGLGWIFHGTGFLLVKVN